jgi:hypothetical protein
MDATIMELEPLSEAAALEYIDPDGDSGDMRRLSWIVETAGLAELPLYLQITRQLSDHNRLDHLTGDGAPMKVDTRTRDRDRSELRLRLLDTWMEALFDGHLMAAVSLNRDEREAAVEWLSALACIGLKADTIDLKFDDYYTSKSSNKTSATQTPRYEAIDKEIQCLIKKKLPRRHLDIRLAVNWGDRLGLVEAHGDGLRFPHSIMQAYLGSRFMQTALEDPKFQKDVKAALEKPGRELLIALVLYSRSKADRKVPARRELVAASAEPPPATAVEVFAAADTPAAAEAPTTTATTAVVATAAITPHSTAAAPPSGNGQPTESEQATAPAGTAGAPHTTTKGICSDVRSIRNVLTRSAGKAQDEVKKLDLYAAALEIDSFLDESRHDFIAHCVGTRWGYIRGGEQRTLDEAKLGLVYRFGDAARAIARRRDRGQDLPEPAYGELLEMGCVESSYPIRLAIAGEIGRGGDPAFRVLHKRSGDKSAAPWTAAAWPGKSANGKKGKKLSANGRNEHKEPDQAIQHADDGKRILQGRTLCAWLAPQLVGSVSDCSKEAQEELARWLGRVGRTDPGRGKGHFPISLEIALAQGFKCAANRRGPHRHGLSETGFYLSEQALEMLQETRFWFSQLTLIQALCLWELQKPGVRRDDNASTRPNGDPRGRNRGRHQPGSDPEATVRRWLEVAGSREHPFVKEAGQLAVLALKTGHPERFLWMDESGVVSSVGSRATQVANGRTPRVWIPPSSGWAALDPRAQQLVADVLLVLNLAERGQQSERIEQRLKRVDGDELPPCLTENRDPLDPRRTVGGLDTEPGNNCLDGCPFGLCPYPPDGLQPYRSELSEAFCRGQQTLLSKGLTAPWQTILRTDLKRFWAGMAKRARGESTAKDAARS